MTDRAHELLPEYVLGTLSEEEEAEVERALAESPELALELRAISDAYDALAASLPPVSPKPETKLRLLATMSENRYLPFVDELSRWFDLAVDRVKQILTMIDDPGAWEPGPMPGIQLIHFAGGPNAFAADTGFVRFPAGLHFPMHSHEGPELTYVLEGTLIDGDGTAYGPGDVLIKETGTSHEYRIGEDRDCVIAIAHVNYRIL
jgi:quercetin dioxygenase-like cupin family protein